MRQAVIARMNDKQRAKEKVAKELDIHFVGSLRGADGQRGIFTFLMIHLEDIKIRSWNVSGSGDDRPTESLDIRYEKMAVAYYGTLDGEIQDACEKAGWKQGEMEWWDDVSSDYWPEIM